MNCIIKLNHYPRYPIILKTNNILKKKDTIYTNKILQTISNITEKIKENQNAHIQTKQNNKKEKRRKKNISKKHATICCHRFPIPNKR